MNDEKTFDIKYKATKQEKIGALIFFVAAAIVILFGLLSK